MGIQSSFAGLEFTDISDNFKITIDSIMQNHPTNFPSNFAPRGRGSGRGRGGARGNGRGRGRGRGGPSFSQHRNGPPHEMFPSVLPRFSFQCFILTKSSTNCVRCTSIGCTFRGYGPKLAQHVEYCALHSELALLRAKVKDLEGSTGDMATSSELAGAMTSSETRPSPAYNSTVGQDQLLSSQSGGS